MTVVRIQQLEQENLTLKLQLSHNEEQLKEQQARILYLERQLYGRRSEKRLPDSVEGQLSLFDPMEGSPSLDQESGLTSLVEEIKHKASLRRQKNKGKATTEQRTYKIPAHIERRETIIEPDNFDPCTMVKIGQDVNERLMLEPSKFWVERIVRPVYKIIEKEPSLSSKIIQASPKQTFLPG